MSSNAIRNFGVVTPGLLYRSGKYTTRQLAQVVQKYGIEQVIDLRDRKPLLARSTYKRIGVAFVHYPIDEYKALPSNALSIWDRETPTLIHCWNGAHRTGAWVARYRISQGWTKEEAIAEMMAYGFGPIGKHRALYESAVV